MTMIKREVLEIFSTPGRYPFTLRV